MKRNGFFVLLLLVALLAIIFLWTVVSPIWAQGDPGVLWKLGKILENQTEIINRLGEIRSELSAIKLKL